MMRRDEYAVYLSRKMFFKTDDVFTRYYNGNELRHVRLKNERLDAHIPASAIRKITKNGELIWKREDRVD